MRGNTLKPHVSCSKLSFFLILLLLSPTLKGQGIILDFPKDALDGSMRPFISHRDSELFGTYLALDLPFAPFDVLRRNLSLILGKTLKTRNEAHITVITPPEYDGVLKGVVSIDEIEGIAFSAGLQSSQVQSLGVGRCFATIGGEQAETYFVLVQSDALLRIRQEIARLFVSRGGDPGRFRAEHFFPHVTVGFTVRDLHESDGIIKDATSRIGEIVLRTE